MGKKVLVCGDRDWSDRETIHACLRALQDRGYDTVIEGEARGADRMASDVAKELGFIVLPFPADWSRYGRAAGPIRNRQMLDQKPSLVLAFHSDIAHSKGTADTVREAQRRRITTVVEDGELRKQ